MTEHNAKFQFNIYFSGGGNPFLLFVVLLLIVGTMIFIFKKYLL